MFLIFCENETILRCEPNCHKNINRSVIDFFRNLRILFSYFAAHSSHLCPYQAMGKLVMITAARSGEVVIDCSIHASSDVYIGDAMQASEGGGKLTLRGINTENCGVV